MERLDQSFWIKRKGILVIAGACGFLFIVFAMHVPVHNLKFMLGVFLVNAFLCSPFTLRTAAGRLWWISFLIILGSGITAVSLGVHNPVSWLCACIASCAYAVGVCLRWYPPSE